MRLIHTSDWQIGKVFQLFEREHEAVLRQERVEVIARLGKAAVEYDAEAVLVAGDVWDKPGVSDRTLAAPMERMREFPQVEWHLIPGNHDPHAPGGPWGRLEGQIPANVRLHVEPKAAPLRDGSEAWVLPAPLDRRHTLGDPTEVMTEMVTPPGVFRVGLAHGSIVAFGSDGATTRNLIAPDRVARARLSYLALGDWHGQKRIDERTWYSGTPEPDGFDQDAAGSALLVELRSPGEAPIVRPIETGRFRWVQHEATIQALEDVEALEVTLRALGEELGRVVLHLEVRGAASLATRGAYERRIKNGVCAAFAAQRVDDSALLVEPTIEDLDAIDHAGFVRAAADRLRARAADAGDPERDVAGLALRELYVLHSEESGR